MLPRNIKEEYHVVYCSVMPDPNNITFVKDRVTFMCIPKCANTSLKLAICRAWGLPATFPGLNHFMSQLRHDCGAVRTSNKEWIIQQQNHCVLSIVRHPQARLASWIRNKCRIKLSENKPPRGVRSHVSAERAGIKYDDSIGTIVDRICETKDEDCDQHYRSISYDLMTNDGVLIPHFVAKVENLAEDWTIFRELVLEWAVKDLGPKLPHVNSSSKENDPIYFTFDQMDALYIRYKKDFHEFNYAPVTGPF